MPISQPDADTAKLEFEKAKEPEPAKTEEPEPAKVEEPEPAKAEEPAPAKEPAKAKEPEPAKKPESKNPVRERPKPARPEPPEPEAPAEESGSSSGMFILLAIVAVIAIVVVTQIGGSGETKPQHAKSDAEPGPVAVTPGPKAPDKSRTEAWKPEEDPDGPKAPQPAGSESESDDGSAADTTEETSTDSETGELQPPPQKPKVADPRSPSVVPANTPEENAKAFFKLPVSMHDGPPLGAIGRSGIHIDEISMGHGYESGDCTEPGQRFSVAGDELANVCFRVVHPREEETVRIYWEKDGVVTRRGKVRIRDIHAYKTRAYLQLRPEYVGSWRVRILPETEDDTPLAVIDFRIVE
ncbi:MAG: DUF2914 domain-containing protein [Myxococcales bacterium]|nr:DUF2914 domain-containing protein [Myxococcales bacterium]